MNVVDIIIIGLLILGVLVGSKRGFTKQLISCLGLVIIIVLAFILKNPVAVFFCEHLPFFPLAGLFKGVAVLNILIYEALAFLLILALLTVIWKILLMATSIFEKILNATIILGIPSKILGGILGFLEAYIIVFISLFVLSLPLFNVKDLDDSKLKDLILKETPFLSDITLDKIKVINELKDLKKQYEGKTKSDEFNLKAVDLFLKYDITTHDAIEVLINKDKLDIKNIDKILKKYD